MQNARPVRPDDTGHKFLAETGSNGKATRTLRVLGALFAFALVPLQSHAQLTVDKLWIDLEPGKATRDDVLLRNESDRRYYISIEPSEVINPGAPDEQRINHENPEDLGLLVSPNRLILEPGEFRSLRVVSINGELDHDRVYRIRVTPKIGEISMEGEATGDDRNATLVVLMAYDLLVVARPPNGKSAIGAERQNGELVLRNSGDSNALLMDGEACVKSGDAENCTRLPDTRLYAGSQTAFPLPAPDAEVRIKSRDRTYMEPRSLKY